MATPCRSLTNGYQCFRGTQSPYIQDNRPHTWYDDLFKRHDTSLPVQRFHSRRPVRCEHRPLGILRSKKEKSQSQSPQTHTKHSSHEWDINPRFRSSSCLTRARPKRHLNEHQSPQIIFLSSNIPTITRCAWTQWMKCDVRHATLFVCGQSASKWRSLSQHCLARHQQQTQQSSARGNLVQQIGKHQCTSVLKILLHLYCAQHWQTAWPEILSKVWCPGRNHSIPPGCCSNSLLKLQSLIWA